MPLFGPPNVEKLKKEGNVKGLIKALRYKKDKHVRHNATYALGMIGRVKKPITLAIDPLITSLEDDYIHQISALSLVRIINAWQPDELYITKIVNALVVAYKQNEDKDFRLGMINALERIEPMRLSICSSPSMNEKTVK